MAIASTKTRSALFIFTTFFLVNCAHHADVRPGADGIHSITLRSESKEGSFRDAKSQADHFCEQFKKTPVVLKEEVKYDGDMDEETYKKTKAISRGAETVGGIGYVFGDKTTSAVSGVVGLAGVGASQYAGEGYTYSMKFECKSF